MLTLELPRVDYDRILEGILNFIRETVDEAGASGVVLGLSGGVDSSLTATLCTRALGKDRVLAVIMPTEFTPKEDIEDAKDLAKWLEIRSKEVNIERISRSFFTELRCDEGDPKQRIPIANLRARIRMVILYYYANLYNRLVAGTGDKSEILIGYFTKYGDGGVDFLPIGHLYKTYVRKLSRHLGLPERIAYKPSSPQLYPGHKATDEIPIGHEKLDPILYGLFELKLSPEAVSAEVGVSIEVVEEVLRRFESTSHKRSLPPRITASPIET